MHVLCGDGKSVVKKIAKTNKKNAAGTKPYLFIIF